MVEYTLIGVGIWQLYLLYKIWDINETVLNSLRRCKKDIELMIKALDRKLENKNK